MDLHQCSGDHSLAHGSVVAYVRAEEGEQLTGVYWLHHGIIRKPMENTLAKLHYRTCEQPITTQRNAN